MKGHQPVPSVTVQRAFVPTRLSDDLLAQAYEHALLSAQQLATTPPPRPTRQPRRRQPLSRVAKTGGRTS